MYDYKFFEIQKQTETKTAILYLNRPEARNAMNMDFWRELPLLVEELEKDSEIRCVVVAAHGKSFSTGLDIVEFFSKSKDIFSGSSGDERQKLRQLILDFQSGMHAMSLGQNVYISAVHKHCIGGALDLIAACDIRLASRDAIVSLRESKVAIVADVGSLNRLPQIIGMGNTRLMAYTGRDFNATECEKMGLFSHVYPDQKVLMEEAMKLAVEIAANPSMAVRGTKKILNYVADHSLADSLDYVATWNAAFLDSLDFREIGRAFVEKRKPNLQ